MPKTANEWTLHFWAQAKNSFIRSRFSGAMVGWLPSCLFVSVLRSQWYRVAMGVLALLVCTSPCFSISSVAHPLLFCKGICAVSLSQGRAVPVLTKISIPLGSIFLIKLAPVHRHTFCCSIKGETYHGRQWRNKKKLHAGRESLKRLTPPNFELKNK